MMACGRPLRSASAWSHGVSATGSGDPVAALMCTTLVTQRRGTPEYPYPAPCFW